VDRRWLHVPPPVWKLPVQNSGVAHQKACG
jgi:hypothetical protein